MAMLFEINQVAKREDLLDLITRVDEKATPFMSLVNKGTTPQNTFISWPLDSYAAPALGGTVDGTDVSSYDNHAASRALLSSYLQTFRKAYQVSRLAQEVSDVAGLGAGNEIAEASAKAGVELVRNMEATLLSDQEHDADDGTNPYLLRGLGVWIRDTTNIGAQTGGHQVPAAFRPAAGQINGDPTADITESDIQTMLQTIWSATGMTGDYKLFADATLRRAFTDFTRTIATAGYSQRNLNYDGDGTRISNTTTIFDGDFGSVEVIADNFIGYNAAGSSQEAGRGYLLDMDKIDLRVNKQPTIERFEDKGGGERFLIEGRAALQVRNPIGLGQFSPAL
ncbi:MAG: DUF5309 family protein [Opitutae bacterium]